MVASGDRLSDIAARYLGDPNRYPELARTGGIANPDLIYPGQRLVLPADARDRGPRYHATGTLTTTSSLPPPAAAPHRAAPPAAHPHPAAPHQADPGPARGSTRSLPTAPPTWAPKTPVPDDGLAAPTPRSSSSPLTPSAAPGHSHATVASPLPAPGSGHATPDRPAEHGVILPSGTWAAGGLAAAVTSAALAVGLHRRRKQRLRWPTRSGLRAEEQALPEMIRVLNACARAWAPPWPPLDPENATDDYTIPGEDRPAEPEDPTTVGVAVGVDGQPISLGQIARAGLALSGPGAVPAGRALLAAALTANSTYAEVIHRVQVVMTSSAVTALLPPGRALPPSEHAIDVRLTTQDAVRSWEREVMNHRRLRQPEDGAPLVPHPDDETLPPLLLIATDVPAELAARIRATLAHAPRCPVGAVLLESAAPAPAYTVAINGILIPTNPTPPAAFNSNRARDTDPGMPIGNEPGSNRAGGNGSGEQEWNGARISTLTAEDLDAVLGLLPVEEPRDAPRPRPAQPAPAAVEVTSGSEQLAPSRPTASSAAAGEPLTAPVSAPPPGPAAPAGPDRPLTTLHLLGRPHFTPAGTRTAITRLRTDSYVIALDLALHPEGRTLDQLATALAPDGDPRSTKERVRSAVTTIRSRLRAHVEVDPPPSFIVFDNARGVYRIDPQVIAVDLWQLHGWLEVARDPDSDTRRQVYALQRAAELHRGELGQGLTQQWIDAWREETRRIVIDALARRAELLDAQDQPDRAIAALEEATGHDPVNEELAVRIMRIQAQRCRPDGVLQAHQRLESRVFEHLGTYPSIELENLRDELIRDARRPPVNT